MKLNITIYSNERDPPVEQVTRLLSQEQQDTPELTLAYYSGEEELKLSYYSGEEGAKHWKELCDQPGCLHQVHLPF